MLFKPEYTGDPQSAKEKVFGRERGMAVLSTLLNQEFVKQDLVCIVMVNFSFFLYFLKMCKLSQGRKSPHANSE